jgi:transposase-like protein
VIFIDAMVVKIRDGQVTNRPIYTAIGVTTDGRREILGLWAGTGGEGAKFWLQVLTEIKNRGIEDVCIVVCDGLKGLPDEIDATWPLAIVQTCVLHLIRNTFRLASRRDWDKMAKDLRPGYTAVNEADAQVRLDEFHDKWGDRYPAIRTLWSNAWSEFVPFLDYSPGIRRVIYSTNAIESLNARFRRATRARGHFPNEQSGWVQRVSATPSSMSEVLCEYRRQAGDPGHGSTRVLGVGALRPGRCGGCRRRWCVEHRRVALVQACWRGDARTFPCRPTDSRRRPSVVPRTRGDQLSPRRW